jgi:hypothetical protein
MWPAGAHSAAKVTASSRMTAMLRKGLRCLNARVRQHAERSNDVFFGDRTANDKLGHEATLLAAPN